VQYGMQTFDQSIMRLHKQGKISFEEAMSNASNPDDLDLRLKGIVGRPTLDEEGNKSSEAETRQHPAARPPRCRGFAKY